MRQPDSVSLDLPAHLAYMHVPGACLAAILEGNEDLKTPEDTVYGLQLAVYEVCTNIVTHAYGVEGYRVTETEPCRIRITFTLALQSRVLIVDLHDTGCSFDPSEVRQPDFTEPQTGGYGLYLVRRLVDEVLYQVESGGNHWQLTKQL